MTLTRRLALWFITCAALAVSVEAQEAASPAGFSGFVETGVGYVNDPSSNRLGNWGGIYDIGGLGFSFSSTYVDFGAAFHFTNDGKYNPTEGWMSQIGNQYFMLDNGYTRLHAAGLAFEAGYMKALPTIETPYDVFLNPSAPSSLGMVLSYENTFFQYESRWIGVNLRSSNPYNYGPSPPDTWQDKGVNHRIIALKFSELRIGYEESSVYLRGFDPNYFFSPLPSILTNTLLTQGSLGNNPWTQGGSQNDGSLMGLFSDYKSGPLYLEAQLLVDDINLNFLFPPNSPLDSPNLNKLAWSIGGRYKFPFGTLGFWHGGATAHTYAATYSSPTNANTIPYEYMYYPVVQFNGNPVDPRDSNIGFPWGENALAFKVTFDTDLLADSPWAFSLSTSLEYVINGSKSPDNPWHQFTAPAQLPQRTQLFNVGGPEVLNNILILHAGVSKKFDNLEARVAIDIGGDFNALQVTPIVDGTLTPPPMLTATPGLNYLILDLQLGVRYTFAPPAR